MRDTAALALCEVDHCHTLSEDVDQPDSTNEVSLSNASSICAIVHTSLLQDASVARQHDWLYYVHMSCAYGYRYWLT
jgi:hypothetical protein